jgi:mannose-1-phosphate guanylyltransferase
VVETTPKGMVKRFVEKPRREEVTTNMINAGIYIVEPEVLGRIPPSVNSSFERELFPQLLKMGEPILGYTSEDYWIDIGTPEKYIKVQHDLLSGKAPSLSHFWGNINESAHCVIAKGARVKGPAVLGQRCQIAEEAFIEEAILWHDSKVGKRAIASNCVLAAHSHIQEDSQVLENCVLGDNVVVGKNNKLAPGTRVWPDKKISDGTLSC